MANGGSDPIPELPASDWDAIKGKDYRDGGLDDGPQRTLYFWIARKDTSGATKWVVGTEGEAGGDGAVRAKLTSAGWDLVQNGTLSASSNWISNGGTDYRLYFDQGSSYDCAKLTIAAV